MTTYDELVSSQPKISNQDFAVKIAKDVLLPEHIEEIYEKVNSTQVQTLESSHGQDTGFGTSGSPSK